jgi:hypothetical protein
VLRGCPPFLAELERRLRAEVPVAEVVPVTDPVVTVHAALRTCVRDGEVRLPAACPRALRGARHGCST